MTSDQNARRLTLAPLYDGLVAEFGVDPLARRSHRVYAGITADLDALEKDTA